MWEGVPAEKGYRAEGVAVHKRGVISNSTVKTNTNIGTMSGAGQRFKLQISMLGNDQEGYGCTSDKVKISNREEIVPDNSEGLPKYRLSKMCRLEQKVKRSHRDWFPWCAYVLAKGEHLYKLKDKHSAISFEKNLSNK